MQCDSPACTSVDDIVSKHSQERDDVTHGLEKDQESPCDAVYGLMHNNSSKNPVHVEEPTHPSSTHPDTTQNNENARNSTPHILLSSPVRHNPTSKNKPELSRDISSRPSSVVSFVKPTTIASTRTSFSSSDIYGCQKKIALSEKTVSAVMPELHDCRPMAFRQMLAPSINVDSNNAMSIVSSASISSPVRNLNETDQQHMPDLTSTYSDNFHIDEAFKATGSRVATPRGTLYKKELKSNNEFENSPCSCSKINVFSMTSNRHSSPITINTSVANTITTKTEKNFANASTSPPNFRNIPTPTVTVSSDSKRQYIKHDNDNVRGNEISKGSLAYSSTTGYVRNKTISQKNCDGDEIERKGNARPAIPTRNGCENTNNDQIAGNETCSSQTFESVPLAHSPSLKYPIGAIGTGSELDHWAGDSIGQHSSGHHVQHHAHFRMADGQPMDLEDVLLLQTPILPPNSHFFCCFYKFHITAVAKVLSVIYAFFYGFLCVLSYKSQHAAAFLIAVLVTFSVGASTLYATFKWSKLCLIPFFLLQIMLILYAIICLTILVYAEIVGPYSYTFREFQMYLDGFLQMSTKSWILLILFGLVMLTLLFCYSALLLWYEYQFIAEVDKFLKSIRKTSSQASRDDMQTHNGANFNSKNAF